MDVLAMFSTAVVRKVVGRYTNSAKSSVSARLAVANTLDASLLLPLAVAHSSSLSRLADKREQQGSRYTQFNNLLDVKYLQLQERLDISESIRRPPTADTDAGQVLKVLHQNWSGDTTWTRTILCGEDTTNTGDSPLATAFDSVWKAVSEGTQLEARSAEKGLSIRFERSVEGS